jgi:two-component system response regulator FixJ
MAKANIYIVDDDEAVRDSLSMLLDMSGYAARTFVSAQAFLETAAALDFGCLVVDLQMPGMTGLELQQQLVERGIKLPVIVVTAHGDIATAVRAMRAGAIDFVEKPFSDDAIQTAIQMGLENRPKPSSADQARNAIQQRLKILSPREREVLDGMVAGHPNKVIAYQLSLSPRTVEIHRARVMDKMQARSLPELVRLALAAGLSQGPEV